MSEGYYFECVFEDCEDKTKHVVSKEEYDEMFDYPRCFDCESYLKHIDTIEIQN